MSKRSTSTKVRLTIALGLMYKELSDMTELDPGRSRVREEGLRTTRLLLNSSRYTERLAEMMDEVE